MATRLLGSAVVAGGLVGLVAGLVLVVFHGQNAFASGMFSVLEEASPNALLLIALILFVDKVLLITAEFGNSEADKQQVAAYQMLRRIVPSAVTAASAGYLTVALTIDGSGLLLVFVVCLLAVGVLIVWLSAYLTGHVDQQPSPRLIDVIIGILIPLFVIACGLVLGA